jgi:hypothetical protein
MPTAISPIFDLDALEQRRMLSGTPQTPPGVTPASVLTDAVRQYVVDEMGNLPAATKTYLNDKAAQGQSGAFDWFLADHFKTRTNASFYFDESQAAGIGTFLSNSGINITDATSKSDAITYNRMVGESESRQPNVQLQADIDWSTGNQSSNGDFLHTLNRHFWFPNMAQAAAIDGDGNHIDDLEFQIADWSQQYVTMDPPSFWSESDRGSWWFDTAIRAEYWTWTYFTALGHGSFDDATTTLMMHKLHQHGEFLYTEGANLKVAGDFGDNRVLTVGKTLHMLGVSFPEFTDAANWAELGRELLKGSLNDGQFFADGVHVEQSPGYAQGAINDLFDAYLLDKANGHHLTEWTAADKQQLANVADAYNQFVTPDGKRPGMGDTYRTTGVTHYLKTAIALDRATPTTTTISSLNFAGGQDGSNVTSVNVADASGYDVGDHVMEQFKTEVMKVSAVSGNTITFERYHAGGTYNGLDTGETLVNFGDTPLAKPRQRDAWLLGESTVQDFLKIPSTGLTGTRGQFAHLDAGGHYIFRNPSEDTQLTFDAGAKGGVHGHFDLLGFELFGGDRPLIADPGPYKYIADKNESGYNIRESIVSTLAHNTINVDRQNHAALEKGTQAAENVEVYQKLDEAGFTQVSAKHTGYAHLTGSPMVGRTVWHDKADTYVIVDYGKATKNQDFGISFTLPSDGSPTNWIDTTDGYQYARSKHASGKNVIIKSLKLPGQTHTNNNSFVTDITDTDYLADAKRLAVRSTTPNAVFVTMIQSYDGSAIPNDNIAVSGTASPDNNFSLVITRGAGGTDTVNLTPPPQESLDPQGAGIAGAYFHDVAYGSDGRLHMVFVDTVDKSFRYTVRDELTGVWAEPTTIDKGDVAGFEDTVGYYADLTIDRNGNPGVSYFDGYYGDLKYAWFGEETKAWEVETIDAKKSVGLYTSLAYSRNSNAPIISYHHRTNGELRVASKNGPNDWFIEVIDGGAVSGTKAGQFSRIAMDPNRTDVNGRWVVAYADTTRNTFKFSAFNGSAGRTIEEVDADMGLLGGYLSMGFVDSGSGHDNAVGGTKWQPVLSYYESAPGTALKYAYRTKTNVAQPGQWTAYYLDGQQGGKRGGLYSSLQVINNRPTIFHFDSKNNQLKRVQQTAGGSWDYTWTAPSGGRLVATDVFNGNLAYTNLDITGGSKVKVAFA